MLRQAGARLMRPKLSASLGHWRHGWEAVAKAEAERALAARESERGAADAARLRELGEQLEAEREKRIAHVQQIAARRIGQLSLARGWSAWHGQVEAHQWRQRMLRQAGARLMRPKLSASLGHWRHDWEAVAKAEAERALAARESERDAADAARLRELGE